MTSRQELYSRLNPPTYKAIEAATAKCKAMRHPYVTLAHWLSMLCAETGNDVAVILTIFKIDRDKILTDIDAYLGRIPSEHDYILDLDRKVDAATETAWTFASIGLKQDSIRSGVLLYAMLKSQFLREELMAISSEFGAIDADRLFHNFDDIEVSSNEPRASMLAPATKYDAANRRPIDIGRHLPANNPGVFLSYSRQDAAIARDIVEELRGEQINVWWDQDMPSVDWQRELARQLDAVAAVVVLWTPHSAESDNVRDEARLGLQRHKLVNVLWGVAQPTFPFDRINGIPLRAWGKQGGGPEWERLLVTLRAHLARSQP